MRLPAPLGWLLAAFACSSVSFAFCPPSSRLSLQRAVDRKAQQQQQRQSSLYFFGRNKDDEKRPGEQEDDKGDEERRRIPFFSRLLERESKAVENETMKLAKEPPSAGTVVSEQETKPVEKTTPHPVIEKVKENDSPLETAKRLKAQAERMRLEAERMDAQLTLDKIGRLEKELVRARKKHEGVEELQKEMLDLQAKMRGEAPKPRVAPPKQNISKTVVLQSTKTTQPSEPVSEENLKKYLQEWKKAPAFSKKLLAGMVGLYGDVEDVNATEVALRMEMRDRSDYSFMEGPMPTFTTEELNKVKKNPFFKLRMTSETASEDEVARKFLEDEYYTELLATQFGATLIGDESNAFLEGLDFEMRNMTELDTITESLFPAATRKEGETPTMAQAMILTTDILPKAGFNPSGKPEQVSGGFLIRGTNKLSDNDKLIEAVDALVAKSQLENKLSVFYIKDYTIFTLDQMESPNFSPADADPILLVTGPNVAREPRRLLYSSVSAVGIASSWYLSIYPFLLNPDLMKRAEEQMQLADANMAYDLTWLTDLSLPLFVTFMGIQLAHEVGHRAVAAAYGMNVTVPVFVPSVVTGMTSVVTTFKSPPKNKQAMFDFAVAGPLTGIAASIATMYFGLQFTVFSTAEAYAQFPALPLEILRQSTLGGGLIEFILGTGALSVPAGSEGTSAIASINIPLHPVAIAGYIGLIVNALALLPIGTTDGGRVSMTLFSRGAKLVVGQLFLFLLLATGLIGSDLFLLYFSFVVFFQRGNEIPARNEVDDVSFSRVLLATFAGVVALLTLIPIS